MQAIKMKSLNIDYKGLKKNKKYLLINFISIRYHTIDLERGNNFANLPPSIE